MELPRAKGIAQFFRKYSIGSQPGLARHSPGFDPGLRQPHKLPHACQSIARASVAFDSYFSLHAPNADIKLGFPPPSIQQPAQAFVAYHPDKKREAPLGTSPIKSIPLDLLNFAF